MESNPQNSQEVWFHILEMAGQLSHHRSSAKANSLHVSSLCEVWLIDITNCPDLKLHRGIKTVSGKQFGETVWMCGRLKHMDPLEMFHNIFSTEVLSNVERQ